MKITEQLIRTATDLLVFRIPHKEGREFVDLTPSVPDNYAVLDTHDIESDDPPTYIGAEQYLKMKPVYQVMNAAISEHDQLVIDEGTERFREDFWARFGEGSQGADIMRRIYRKKLADRLIRMLEKDGEAAIVFLSGSKRMMNSLAKAVADNC